MRSLSAASPTTFVTSDGSTPFHETAVWSAAPSAMMRLVWVTRSGPNDQTNASGYWWRTGSVAGSHAVLRSIVSRVPASFFVILYGPEETGLVSYCVPVSFAAGTGAVAGRDAAKGRSQCGRAKVNCSVRSSGTV